MDVALTRVWKATSGLFLEGNSLYSSRDSPSKLNSSTLDVVCTTGCGEVYSTYLDLVRLLTMNYPHGAYGTSSLGDRCYYSLPKNMMYHS